MQGVVNRLATQSASCKTWCLTLVGALISLAGATHVPGIVQFAIFPIVVFAYLDVMYLANERAFRDLFNAAAEAAASGTYPHSRAFYSRPATVDWRLALKAFTSWSVRPVYGLLVVAYFVAWFTGWIDALANAPR